LNESESGQFNQSTSQRGNLSLFFSEIVARHAAAGRKDEEQSSLPTTKVMSTLVIAIFSDCKIPS
jgi:hypothetical protein